MSLTGRYILVFKIERPLVLQISTLNYGKSFSLDPEYYGYIGSAMGPGGIFSRVSRHIKRDKKIKWHIDYITSHEEVMFLFVYWVNSKNLSECDIVRVLHKHGLGKAIVRGFGATDSPCYSHLIHIEAKIPIFLFSVKKLFNGGFLKFYPDL